MSFKRVSSESMTNYHKHYYNADKYGPNRKTTSWTSTPDLTTISDSVTPHVEKLKGICEKNIFYTFIISCNIYYIMQKIIN